MKGGLVPQIDRLEREGSKLADEETSNKREMIEQCFRFLRNLPELFTSADLEGKHRCLGSTFPKKMVFENGEVRTKEPHPILALKHKPTKASSASKRKAPDDSGALTNMVNRWGLCFPVKMQAYGAFSRIMIIFVQVLIRYNQPLNAVFQIQPRQNNWYPL